MCADSSQAHKGKALKIDWLIKSSTTGNYALAVRTGNLLFLGPCSHAWSRAIQARHFFILFCFILFFNCPSKSTPDNPHARTHTAGHIPIGPGGGVMTGKVGADVTVEKAQEAARAIAINLLATLKGG